jgi:taurine dioxygenase
MHLMSRPLAPIGAEVIGIDLEKPLNQATVASIRELWIENGILLFRGAGKSPEAHIRLSECFGELQPAATVVNRSKENPLLMEVTHDPASEPLKTYTIYELFGQERSGFISWHWDQAFTAEIVRGAVLRMITPAAEDGRTGFIDGLAAYARLPAELARKIENLEVVYHFTAKQEENWLCKPDSLKVLSRLPGSDEAFAKYKRDFPPVVHPLVITQRETGRKVLKLCPMHCQYVLGMNLAEGEALLRELTRYLLDERFAYYHTWQANDMMVWDNWRIIHSVTGVPPQVFRRAQRTTIVGDYKLGRYLSAQEKEPVAAFDD